MRNIRGKKALVTGAASGIGREIALALAREGADLILTDVNRRGLDETAEAARASGAGVKVVPGDLTVAEELRVLVQAVKDEGRLNILINNAGVVYYGAMHAMSDAQWDRLMAVNLIAPVQLTRGLLPLLLAADEAHVMNVCSIFGLVPRRKIAAYQTSKFGLVGFSAALRAEYCSPKFGVTALCPGFVRTPFIEALGADSPDATPKKIPGFVCTSPKRVAAAAIAALRSNKGLVVITPLAHLFWWSMRVSPRLVDWVARGGWKRRR